MYSLSSILKAPSVRLSQRCKNGINQRCRFLLYISKLDCRSEVRQRSDQQVLHNQLWCTVWCPRSKVLYFLSTDAMHLITDCNIGPQDKADNLQCYSRVTSWAWADQSVASVSCQQNQSHHLCGTHTPMSPWSIDHHIKSPGLVHCAPCPGAPALGHAQRAEKVAQSHRPSAGTSLLAELWLSHIHWQLWQQAMVIIYAQSTSRPEWYL